MDFFKCGLITARLKSGGTTDLVRDAFMIVVISGTSSDEHYFSSHVGIGSSSQVLQGATSTSRSTSDSVIDIKFIRGTPSKQTSSLSAALVERATETNSASGGSALAGETLT